jgi:hypothetical protein
MFKNVLTKLISFYQRWLSPLLPHSCRFEPTCSEYMKRAVQKYGVAKGIGKGLMRLGKCHPWHAGGFDPVS